MSAAVKSGARGYPNATRDSSPKDRMDKQTATFDPGTSVDKCVLCCTSSLHKVGALKTYLSSSHTDSGRLEWPFSKIILLS